MNAHAPTTAAEAAYIDAAAALAPARREAFARFSATGMPHRRLEEWRWSDLRQRLDRPYPPAAPTAYDRPAVERLVAASPFPAVAPVRLVLVDGVFRPELSKLPGTDELAVAWSEAISGVDADGEPLEALNGAFAPGTLRLDVASGQADSRWVELVFVTTAREQATYAARVEISVGEGATLRLAEAHLGAEGAFVSLPVVAITLGGGARLDRVKAATEPETAHHLASTVLTLGANAIVRDYTLTMGAGFTRHQQTVRFTGEGGDARIAGSYLLKDRQHCDTRLVVDHRVPHCTSREVFKVVMDDEARGIFQGKVIVRPGAQKTDGKQSSHALLLSPAAEFDAKPELEIFADDVVCGHGATAGDIEEDHLFYLRARGIPEAEAKALLIEAFVAEAFGDDMEEGVREALADMARGWLARRGQR
jgi:Fe-S cluster assembly protein SufD